MKVRLLLLAIGIWSFSISAMGQQYADWDWQLDERTQKALEIGIEAFTCMPSDDDRNNLYLIYRADQHLWFAGKNYLLADTSRLKIALKRHLQNQGRKKRLPVNFAETSVVLDVILSSQHEKVKSMDRLSTCEFDPVPLIKGVYTDVEEQLGIQHPCGVPIFPVFLIDDLFTDVTGHPDSQQVNEPPFKLLPQGLPRNVLKLEVLSPDSIRVDGVLLSFQSIAEEVRLFYWHAPGIDSLPEFDSVSVEQCQMELLQLHRRMMGTIHDQKLLDKKEKWERNRNTAYRVGTFRQLDADCQIQIEVAASDSTLESATKVLEVVQSTVRQLRSEICQKYYQVDYELLDPSNEFDQNWLIVAETLVPDFVRVVRKR